MLNNIYVRIFIILFIIGMYFLLRSNDRDYNVYKCQTKDMPIKGVLDFVSGRSSYMKAHVDNIEHSFSLNIDEIIYKKGFPEYYSYEVGDSIIKKANSKEVTIKRGDSIAVYILDCDD
jgi:hypothetical protein